MGKGSFISMPHLDAMDWTPDKHLHHVKRGTSETWYTYDSTGQRVRKFTEKGGITEERLYLGGFEIYRKRQRSTVVLERETLHLMDGARRIAMVETKTVDTSSTSTLPTTVTRYQLDNHLQSATLELDETASVISYEEYYPYGDTSYRSARSDVEVSEKRYRYTGKEKDEETGLYYHGARYYAAWLGRWTAADPAGMVDGACLYAYVKNTPISAIDLTGKWTVKFAFTSAQSTQAERIVAQQENNQQTANSSTMKIQVSKGIEFNDRTDTSGRIAKFIKHSIIGKLMSVIPFSNGMKEAGEIILPSPIEVYTPQFVAYAKTKEIHLDKDGKIAKPNQFGQYDKSTKEIELIDYLDSKAEQHFGKHNRMTIEAYRTKQKEFIQGVYNDSGLNKVFTDDNWSLEPSPLGNPIAFKSMDDITSEAQSKIDIISKALTKSDKETKDGILDWLKDKAKNYGSDKAKDFGKDKIKDIIHVN